MTTIYIVTSGRYSEYNINGVFDSQEKAQAFIDYEKRTDGQYYYDDPGIEEWELNQYYDYISRGLSFFYVLFENINEGDGKVELLGYVSDDGEESTYTNYLSGIKSYQTWVWTTDEASALKIANERRVQYVVNTQVPEEPDSKQE